MKKINEILEAVKNEAVKYGDTFNIDITRFNNEYETFENLSIDEALQMLENEMEDLTLADVRNWYNEQGQANDGEYNIDINLYAVDNDDVNNNINLSLSQKETKEIVDMIDGDYINEIDAMDNSLKGLMLAKVIEGAK